MKTKKLMIYFVLVVVSMSISMLTTRNVSSHDLPVSHNSSYFQNETIPSSKIGNTHVQTNISNTLEGYNNLYGHTNSGSVNKYALLVGIELYYPYARNLSYTVDDVYDMCDVLINNCYFEPENIRVLTDANATKTNIKNNITWIASNAKTNDTVLFFFSGHGSPNHILAYNSTISDDELNLWFNDIKSNLVVIIDSCYAGYMVEPVKSVLDYDYRTGDLASDYNYRIQNYSNIDGIKSVSSSSNITGGSTKGLGHDNRIVLAACDKNQYSWEYDELSNGVFTYYLTEGLKSEVADTNGNGWVSVEEAFYYAKPRTYEFNNSENPAGGQNPQIYDGIEGELDISSLTPTGDLIVDDTKTYSGLLPINRNLTVTNNGNLTLNNVTLLMNPLFNREYHIEVQSGGQLYVYNSNITSLTGYHYLFWVRNNSRFEMRDSELHECGYEMLEGNYSHAGLWINTDNVKLYNNIFSGNYVGVCFYLSENNSIINSTVSNNTQYDICLKNSMSQMLNTTFNKTKVSMINSSITVSWYLSVDVLYQNGTPVENASVTAACNLTRLYNISTDKDGIIKNIIVQEYIRNQTTVTYFTPYLITVSRNGYYGSATVDMNQSKVITIYLEEDKTPPDAEAGDDRTVDEDMEIELNASLSSDTIGIVNYTWSFADQGKQITLYGNTVRYNFIQPGFYTIRLNVSDKAGNYDTDIVNITVKDITKPVIENVSIQITSYMDCTIECAVSDNVGVGDVEISIDNHSWKKCLREGNKYVGEIGLGLGNNIVYVKATDPSGNVNITTVPVFVKMQEKQNMDFIYDAIIFIIILIFCMCLTIVLEHKPKRRKGL